MSSNRTKWTDFDKETKRYIKKRDGGCCVICGKAGATQCMHVFMSRAQGGKGCKENGASGCPNCHRINDNPIGKKERELSITNNYKVKKYLIEKENITVNKEFLDSLKYKKIPIPFEERKKVVDEKKCKDCKYLVKDKYNKSTIPNYYCKKLNKIVGKRNIKCNKFMEVEHGKFS